LNRPHGFPAERESRHPDPSALAAVSDRLLNGRKNEFRVDDRRSSGRACRRRLAAGPSFPNKRMEHVPADVERSSFNVAFKSKIGVVSRACPIFSDASPVT